MAKLTKLLILNFLLAAFAFAQSPSVPIIEIRQATVIAFFPPMTDTQLERDPDTNEALADFQTYASRVRKPLESSGIDFRELYVHEFRIRVGKSVTRFRPQRVKIGYYLIAPGKKPRIEYGVMTDWDLQQTAKQYFGK